jgi:hypothetical protein
MPYFIGQPMSLQQSPLFEVAAASTGPDTRDMSRNNGGH